jgi:hypothetical protein
VVAGIAALIYFTPVFAVRAGDIEVRGLGGWVDRNAVSEVLSKDVGVPLARLSTKRLEAALEAMPAVESAEVKRDWPTGLTVTLVPRVPAAAVLDGDLYVLLDASAEEVAWVEDPPDGLPVGERAARTVRLGGRLDGRRAGRRAAPITRFKARRRVVPAHANRRRSPALASDPRLTEPWPRPSRRR